VLFIHCDNKYILSVLCLCYCTLFVHCCTLTIFQNVMCQVVVMIVWYWCAGVVMHTQLWCAPVSVTCHGCSTGDAAVSLCEIVIVRGMTVFMVLSSWHGRCKSSPGSFDECRTALGGCQSFDQANQLELLGPKAGTRFTVPHRVNVVRWFSCP